MEIGRAHNLYRILIVSPFFCYFMPISAVYVCVCTFISRKFYAYFLCQLHTEEKCRYFYSISKYLPKYFVVIQEKKTEAPSRPPPLKI